MPPTPREGTLLICATPRCGSTYFCALLRQADTAGWPAEWLGRAGEQHFRELYGMPETAGFADFVAELRAQRSGDDGTFSVKAMWPHLVQFLARGREAGGFDESVSDRAVLEHFLGPLRVLYLYREDAVGQAISLYRAQRTRLWHQLSEHGHYLELEAPYDHAAIAEQLKWIRFHNRRWRDFFQRQALPAVERRFEDFAKTPPAEMIAGTLAELGLEAPRRPVGEATSTHRQSDGLNRRWRERFEARVARAEAFPGSKHDRPYPESAYALDLQLAETVITSRAGTLSRHLLTVHNRSAQEWMDVGEAEGAREALLEITLRPETGEPILLEQPLHAPLPANAEAAIPWFLPETLAPGGYALRIDLRRRGEAAISERGGTAAEGFIWIETDDRAARAADFFGVPVPADPKTPVAVPFLGLVHVEYFPWVRHPQLEWIRFGGTGVAGDDYWCFIPDVGLVTTTEALFPRFFVPGHGEWLRFEGVESKGKDFVREATGERIRLKFQAHELPFRADPLFA